MKSCFKLENIVLAALFLAAGCLQVKYIFTEFNIDTEYAIATSWRMLKGDAMFIDMWEPHQTSAFLLTFIMNIYMRIFHDYAGIVLFINIAGVLIHTCITGILYINLKDKMEPLLVKFICILFWILHPKNYITPEFSNMIIWFSVLLLLSLFSYYNHPEKKSRLLLASLCLCLLILSYPSCLIVYLGVIALLFAFSKEKYKDIFIFSVSCAVQGIIYVGYFVYKIGFSKFAESINNIILGDSFHGTNRDIYGGLFKGIPDVLLWLGLCYLGGFILTKLMDKFRNNSSWAKGSAVCFLIFTVLVCVSDIFASIFFIDRYNTFAFAIYFIIFTGYFRKGIFLLNHTEKVFVLSAYGISAATYLAVCMLTNLSLIFSSQYLILAIVISFIPAMKLMKERGFGRLAYVLFGLIVFLFLFKGFLSIREVETRIVFGPARGIYTDYTTMDKHQRNVADWIKYVEDGDSVLIVAENSVNSIGYLLGNTKVSTHSTMCAPTYNEILLKYWETHPEKYPDVIAVECWQGELKVDRDSWMMQWIESSYQPYSYQNGFYYRFYRLKD